MPLPPVQPAFLLLAALLLLPTAYAQPYDGFTEPDQEIKVAAPEIGVLATLNVKEGQTVKQGQVLATLDNQVLVAGLAVARAKAKASGRLNAAQALQKLNETKLSRLQPLLARGAAQQAEVDQVSAELSNARASAQAAREELQVSALEVKQIEAQIERRTLRSPINGVVIELKKEVSELVGGTANEPQVLTVARIDPLLVTIHVPTSEALKLSLDQKVAIEFPAYTPASAEGTVTFVSPITDAGSNTVKIKIRLDNSAGKLRSGLKCLVKLP